MQWYKHDADASSDAKIRKLLIRHGAVGYAIYFHCLELIARDISESNITFELEHDAEIIADNLKIKGDSSRSSIDIVNEVMRYIVELGLFENRDGRITCFKMLKRLDQSMTGNFNMRKLIAAAKEDHDAVMMDHDAVMREETRIDKKRKEENKERVQKAKPEKIHYADTVTLTEAEYDKLVAKYGEEQTAKLIDTLDAAKQAKGYKYKSDAGAIRSWVIEKVKPTEVSAPKLQARRTCTSCGADYLASLDVCPKCGAEHD